MTKLNQAHLSLDARGRGQRRELSAAGTKTVYWFYPARAKKPVASVILIHGYRGNHHGLEAIAGAIQDLDVYIPDLPGFGQSAPFENEHTIEHYAQWVGDFIEQLKLKKKPHLLGHSFGSIVVSCYAAGDPQIETLILENPVSAPALTGPRAFTTTIAKSFFVIAGLLPEAAGQWVLKSWPMVRGMSIIMTKSRIKELRQWIHKQHDDNFNDYANRRVALEGYAASISNCVSDYANAFRVPVLALTATLDDITSIKQQQAMFALIESPAQLKVFENVGHLTHYEIPEKIAGAIEQWVRDRG
jgi:pimeloyl-ACP methyl ester carboxylesterase